jgi:hypothetical protein
MPLRTVCPGCKKPFNAPDALVGKNVNCPVCKTRFVVESPRSPPRLPSIDAPPGRPTISDLPEITHQRDLFDYAISFSLGAIPSLAVLGLGSILFGSSEVLVLIGTICVVLSLAFFARYSFLQKNIRRQATELKGLREALETRTSDLRTALDKFDLFQNSFDELIRKKSHALKEEYSDAESMFAFANERAKTIDRLGKRLLADTVRWESAKLNSNNFTATSDRLRSAIAFCRKHEFDVPAPYEKQLLSDLQAEFESVLRREQAREEQARIKARIRDEQKAEQELEKEMRRIEAERAAIEKALEAALLVTNDEHSAEIEALKLKLQEAEQKGMRALSMAQQTKAGNVYVISNMGSFGEEVFKIGMTRRLEPLDRIKELGDASVPFPFDVHMMIACDNAPALENALHRAFHFKRLNKINLRREFFRVTLDEIRQIVVQHHGEVEYVIDPQAIEYRQSINMPDSEFACISSQVKEMDFEDVEELVE